MLFLRQLLQVLQAVVIANAIPVVHLVLGSDQVIWMGRVPHRVRALNAPALTMAYGRRPASRLLGHEGLSNVATEGGPLSTSPVGMARAAAPARRLQRASSDSSVVAWLEARLLAARIVAVRVDGRSELLAYRRNECAAIACAHNLRHRIDSSIFTFPECALSLRRGHTHIAYSTTEGATYGGVSSLQKLGRRRNSYS
jgi:hypothetical protein